MHRRERQDQEEYLARRDENVEGCSIMDRSDCFGQRQSDGSRKGSFRLWLGHKPLEVRGHASPSLHRPAIGMVLWAHLLSVQ